MKPCIPTLAALCALLICPKSFATTWRGTITETVETSNSALYGVGDVVEGWYEYDSDTIDGSFTNLSSGGSLNGGFRASIFNFRVQPVALTHPDGWANAVPGDFNSVLTVTGGEVSDFWIKRLYQGPYTGSFLFYNSGFGSEYYDSPSRSYNDNVLAPLIQVSGTLSYSAPQAVNVPEAASTLLLSALPFLAALFWRKNAR